jgi:hypothetical protein
LQSWRDPYLQHTENVLLAKTSDHGKTWHKRDRDPVISSPSDYWNITAWRDPLAVFEADLLRETVFTKDGHGTAYISLGSGLKGDDNVAGRVLLYHTVVSPQLRASSTHIDSSYRIRTQSI